MCPEACDYPISDNEIEGMERLGIHRSYLDLLLTQYPLDEVMKYIRVSIRPGDDGDEAAGPRAILQ